MAIWQTPSPLPCPHSFGGMYKPRRQMRGEGVAQMSTLLNKSYLVKVYTKGDPLQILQILSMCFVHSSLLFEPAAGIGISVNLDFPYFPEFTIFRNLS